jgi:hypothetical protein
VAEALRPLLLLSLVALAVGCLSPAATTPPAPGSPQALASVDALDAAAQAAIGAPIVADHDHADPKLHNASYQMTRVALVTGNEGDQLPEQGEAFAETAVKDGYAYLTRYGTDSGLAIFNVSDIEHPKFVGSVRLDEGFEPDIEVSDDGHWAFWETQRFPTTATVPDVTNPVSNAPHGVHIVDISDKAHPKDVGFYPVPPDGPHSITYANISGRNILFLDVYAFAYAYENVEVPNAQRLEITELDTSGPVPTLKELATYVEPGSTGQGPGNFPHDVSITKHPLTGQYVAEIGYWDQGMVSLDVTDPAHPKELSKFTDFGPAKYRQIHMCRAFPQLFGQKQYSVCEPEHSGEGGADTGYMSFLDTTDPTHPTYVSSWLLPGNLTAQGLRFSPHYFDVLNGHVALASYHAGLWILDARDIEHPADVAFAEVPGSGTSVGVGPFSQSEGSAFDAWWADPTHVVAGDSTGGLAVYKVTGVAAAEP